ncbi:MAG: ABC transporter substrate binding protein, partial [Dongiaceae bacterium]
MMDRRRLLLATSGAVFAAPWAAAAQPPGKLHRIGWLSSAPPTAPELWPLWPALVDGLRELGWVEGKDYVFERRFTEGRSERFAALAAELVQAKVDIIVSVGTLGTMAAKRATSTIPIVMLNVGDPVGSGLVASLGRPGANVT